MYIKEMIWELDNTDNSIVLLNSSDWYEAGFAGRDFNTVSELLDALILEYGDKYEVITDDEGLVEGFEFITQEKYIDVDEYFTKKTDIFISMTEPVIDTIESNITLPVL